MGVVFVDLDQDIIHLGWSDEDGPTPAASMNKGEPRRTPALPEKEASKLKQRLASCAAAVYLLPDSGKAGCITYGDEKPLPFGERDLYSRITSAEVPTQQQGRRKEYFATVDRAYDDDGEIYTSPDDFLSGQGLFHEKQERVTTTPSPSNKRNLRLVRRLLPTRSPSPASPTTGDELETADSSDLPGGVSRTTGAQNRSSLSSEGDDFKGFSVPDIRNAFLRFFVGLFKGYRDFIQEEDGTFRSEDFIARMNLSSSPRSRDYMESVTRTQMFERFIQERLEDPDDPEVMFFDESIDVKQSRFRKAPFTRIRNAGKKGDSFSFLEDKSKQVTEKYTPPPPSHLGLPDDGRTYHYGSFPDLDPALFGKVRPPMMWKEYHSKSAASSMRLRASSEIVKKQQSLVNGILGAANTRGNGVAPTASALAGGGPNALEIALVTLARPFMESTQQEQKNGADGNGVPTSLKHKKSSSQQRLGSSTSKDDGSPEEVVLASRRLSSVLVQLFVAFQAQVRGYLVRTRPTRAATVTNTTPVTTTVGDSKPVTIEEASPDLSAAPSKEEMEKHEYAFSVLQQAFRWRQSQEVLRRKSEAATKMQSLIRKYMKQCEFAKVRRGVVHLQATVRGRRICLTYQLVLDAMARAQARYRGYKVRHGLHQVFQSRLVLYRRQIFILWKRAHTSLAYRTKFWTAIESQSFLRHNLAEYELKRLWKELNLIEGMGLLLDEPADELAILASKLGLSNTTYIASLTLDESLDVDRDDDLSFVGSIGSTTYSSKSQSAASSSAKSYSVTSSMDGTNHGGNGGNGISFLLNSERTQIYERLSQSSHIGNDQQAKRLFETFKIGPRVKKRKKSLAEAVWRNLDQASESAALMYELFPELRNSDTLRFVEPSRKGIRRFRYDMKPVADFETTTLRAQKLVDDRIRNNVSLVASAGLCRIPVLMHHPSSSQVVEVKNHSHAKRERRSDQRRRQQALMQVGGYKSWSQCRLHWMQALVSNSL